MITTGASAAARSHDVTAQLTSCKPSPINTMTRPNAEGRTNKKKKKKTMRRDDKHANRRHHVGERVEERIYCSVLA